jgi:diguanylate cyclase (GGDEF)-like protein/PAS domain S-box-containing protein
MYQVLSKYWLTPALTITLFLMANSAWAIGDSTLSSTLPTNLLLVLLGSLFTLVLFRFKTKGLSDNIKKLSAELNQQHQYLDKFDAQVICSRTDADLNITYASRALQKISGYTESELLGQPITLLLDPKLGSELYDEIIETINDEGYWRGTVRHQGKGYKYYWVESIVEPLFDQAGRLCGYNQIRQDVTSQKRLEELWMTDHLTGLANRQKIDEIWEREILRSLRYGDLFSVLLIDIDHFKQVNDIYGHLCGDDLLYAFALLLKASCRDTDHVGRWGGEEFIVLIPNTNLSSAVLMADKLRATIAEHVFTTVGTLTVSIGVATYRNGMSEDDLFQLADNALYRAKSNGRNRVEVGHTTGLEHNKTVQSITPFDREKSISPKQLH